MSFTAQYPGECATCGNQVKGQEVTFAAFDEIVHVICPPDLTVAGKVCPRCFMELPVTGVCSDCGD